MASKLVFRVAVSSLIAVVEFMLTRFVWMESGRDSLQTLKQDLYFLDKRHAVRLTNSVRQVHRKDKTHRKQHLKHQK